VAEWFFAGLIVGVLIGYAICMCLARWSVAREKRAGRLVYRLSDPEFQPAAWRVTDDQAQFQHLMLSNIRWRLDG
jgi:hypothetical protein